MVQPTRVVRILLDGDREALLFYQRDHREDEEANSGLSWPPIPDPDTRDTKDQLEGTYLEPGMTINIVKDGDLLLGLRADIHVRVDSRTLHRASLLFSTMLDSTFVEGSLELSSTNPPTLPLLDDNVDTVIRLCRILHGRYRPYRDSVLAEENMSLWPGYVKDQNWIKPTTALVDLAQLSHKWDCVEAARHTIVKLKTSLVERRPAPSPVDFCFWNAYHDVTLSFFMDDTVQFCASTALMMARCEDGRDLGATPPWKELNKWGLCSSYVWFDVVQDDKDFRDIFTDAVVSARDCLLGNLQRVASYFLDDRSGWYCNSQGWVDEMGPKDSEWKGRGPPEFLVDYVEHWFEAPYNDAKLRPTHCVPGSATLLDMLATVERLNQGVPMDGKLRGLRNLWGYGNKDLEPVRLSEHRYKTRGWKQDGLYISPTMALRPVFTSTTVSTWLSTMQWLSSTEGSVCTMSARLMYTLMAHAWHTHAGLNSLRRSTLMNYGRHGSSTRPEAHSF